MIGSFSRRGALQNLQNRFISPNDDNLWLPAPTKAFVRFSHFVLLTQGMSSDNHRDRDVREKIVSLMQSIGRAPKRQVTSEELQKLQNAAGRLDQMLKASANADLQNLRNASLRLDQLLSDIRKGKDVTNDLKRRGGENKTE